MDKVLVCKECAQERDLQIILEAGIPQAAVCAYVEDYFKPTLSDEQKGIREMCTKITLPNDFSSGLVLHIYI